MKTLANWYALIIGLIALAGSAASALLDRQQFGRSGEIGVRVKTARGQIGVTY